MNQIKSIRQTDRQTDRQTIRLSNFELLRIFAMIFIIASHFSGKAGFSFSNETITVNRLWSQFLDMWGSIGVNIFVLISGYFLVTAKSIKTSKVLKLWIQVFAYSIGIYLVLCAFKVEEFSASTFALYCLPILWKVWWFASTYFAMYLLSPFINWFLNSLNKKQYFQFLFVIGLFWVVVPTVLMFDFEMNNLLWFIYLYSFAGYIRLYKPKTKLKSSHYLVLASITVLLTFVSVVIFDVIGKTRSDFEMNYYFYAGNRIPVFLISTFIFIGFSKLEIKHSSFINSVAATTFGVYLIHEHGVARKLIWNIIFRTSSFENNKWLIPYSILVVIVVFAVCSIIEFIRLNFIEKYYMKIINTLSERIDNKQEKVFNKLFSFVEQKTDPEGNLPKEE